MDTKEAGKSFKSRGCIYSTAHGFQEFTKTFKHTNKVCTRMFAHRVIS